MMVNAGRIGYWTVIVCLCSTVARAQTNADAAFEVASVKRNLSSGRCQQVISPGVGVRIVDCQLLHIVADAFGIPVTSERYRLAGGRTDVLTARFDIRASLPPNVDEDTYRQMLRALLQERFRLRVRTEVKREPAFALKLVRPGQLGPQLHPTSADCLDRLGGFTGSSGALVARDPELCSGRLTSGVMTIASAGSVAYLVERIQGFVERPLVDDTGLSGNLSWKLSFSMVALGPSSSEPAIEVALREQLGLTLQPTVAPIEVVVIDSIDFPIDD